MVCIYSQCSKVSHQEGVKRFCQATRKGLWKHQPSQQRSELCSKASFCFLALLLENAPSAQLRAGRRTLALLATRCRGHTTWTRETGIGNLEEIEESGSKTREKKEKATPESTVKEQSAGEASDNSDVCPLSYFSWWFICLLFIQLRVPGILCCTSVPTSVPADCSLTTALPMLPTQQRVVASLCMTETVPQTFHVGIQLF